MQRRLAFTLFAALMLAAFFVSDTQAGKGGGSPPADPAIAFAKSGTTYQLVVMNADGSNQTTIYKAANFRSISSPSWSPAGNQIAFYQTSPAELWVIDVVVQNGVPKGQNARVLVPNSPYYPTTLAWSSLNQEIVFVSGPNHDSLAVVPATGGTPQIIYTEPNGLPLVDPTWNPQGDQIAFAVNGAHEVRILDRVAGATITVFSAGSDFTVTDTDWARTGDVLAFRVTPFSANDPRVYTLDLTTNALVERVPGMDPTWSPDDTRLLFREQGRSQYLTILNLATGVTTRTGAKGFDPDWRRF